MKTTLSSSAHKGLKLSTNPQPTTSGPSAKSLKQQLVSFKGAVMSARLSGPADHGNSQNNGSFIREQTALAQEQASHAIESRQEKFYRKQEASVELQRSSLLDKSFEMKPSCSDT